VRLKCFFTNVLSIFRSGNYWAYTVQLLPFQNIGDVYVNYKFVKLALMIQIFAIHCSGMQCVKIPSTTGRSAMYTLPYPPYICNSQLREIFWVKGTVIISLAKYNMRGEYSALPSTNLSYYHNLSNLSLINMLRYSHKWLLLSYKWCTVMVLRLVIALKYLYFSDFIKEIIQRIFCPLGCVVPILL